MDVQKISATSLILAAFFNCSGAATQISIVDPVDSSMGIAEDVKKPLDQVYVRFPKDGLRYATNELR